MLGSCKLPKPVGAAVDAGLTPKAEPDVPAKQRMPTITWQVVMLMMMLMVVDVDGEDEACIAAASIH